MVYFCIVKSNFKLQTMDNKGSAKKTKNLVLRLIIGNALPLPSIYQENKHLLVYQNKHPYS